MKKDSKNYTGIDFFRLIAAVFIVAIHTSPLASLGEDGRFADFILTRIIARVAVPFFFMTSGFFLITRYHYDDGKLRDFVKKTACIYGAAIVLYMPVNLYNGYFKVENLLPNMIKDIVFDGTLYHLWYLPAAIIGGVTAWYLVIGLDYKKALMATAALYLIGLGGDSYYGAVKRLSVCEGFYALLFQVSDYTRNGIFFAPVFFVMGGWIHESRDRIRLRGAVQGSGTRNAYDERAYRKKMLLQNVFGFGVCLGLMLMEGLTLHHFQMQRHDSMYLFLLPCMYFLFSFLLNFRGKRYAWMRDVSLIVYIIHPMVIVGIRLLAKLFHLQKLLVDNSVIHFLVVVMVSFAISVTVVVLWGKCAPKRSRQNGSTDRAYVELHLDNLAHNVKVLRGAMQPGCELMAVVKAKAYGHGMYEIATHLEKIGVTAFAVATIDEAVTLRKYGIRGEILILGYTAPTRAGELRRFQLTQTLVDYDYACQLDAQGCIVRAHIKLDTGMHRLGFDCDTRKIRRVFAMKHIRVEGIYTHLCAADSLEAKDVRFTRQQITDFYKVVKALKKQGIRIPKIHIQSSYGLLNYPELKCNYVRAGIALYGVLSTLDTATKLRLDLRPVLSLKAKVVLVRFVCAGESIGYGRTFAADRDSVIAIVSIGYADGFPRNLSNQGAEVLINGCRAPVVGRICMDQLAVDVTDIPDVTVHSVVTLIGRDGDEEITAPMIAESSESITNELLSRMGRRLKIHIFQGG